MLHSLQKLAALPSTTKVYCTHEYTLHNINFALTLEPNNQTLIERYKNTREMRESNVPSLPSTIKLELASNPFLRCDSEEIQSSIQLKNASEIDIFSKLRELRNSY
jgi:hydroxyacylglutathione hydrolase